MRQKRGKTKKINGNRPLQLPCHVSADELAKVMADGVAHGHAYASAWIRQRLDLPPVTRGRPKSEKRH